jgi:uncharacterized protein Veg
MYRVIDNIYISNLTTALAVAKSFAGDIIIRLSEDKTETGNYNFELNDNMMYAAEMLKIGFQIIKIIRANPGRRILIHCNEGRSRSASVIILYLIIDHGKSFAEALGHLKTIKPDVNPNLGFKAALKIAETRNPEEIKKFIIAEEKKYENIKIFLKK